VVRKRAANGASSSFLNLRREELFPTLCHRKNLLSKILPGREDGEQATTAVMQRVIFRLTISSCGSGPSLTETNAIAPTAALGPHRRRGIGQRQRRRLDQSPPLFVYLLPLCLEAGPDDLRGTHRGYGGFVEHFYPVLGLFGSKDSDEEAADPRVQSKCRFQENQTETY
jgi:hypothetical protein